MPQSADKVLQSLKKGEYASVYFFQGEESFYIDLLSDFIEQNAIPEHERSFNHIILYGKDVDMSTVMANAKRFPMMAEKQLVLVKEAQEMGDLTKESGTKQLQSYLENPLPSTILVFCHKYKSIDARKSIAKTLDKHSVLVTSKKLYDNQIADWVTNYIKGKSYVITPKASHMIAEFVGNNLSRISNEIDKMLINYKEGMSISENEVEKNIGVSKEFNAFELQKALIQKNVLKANQIINHFAENPKKNPVIPIIALLFSFYSKLLMVHHQKDKSDKNIAAILRVNPYFVKDYLQAVRKYNVKQVVNNIHYIHLADLQSKGVNIGMVNDGQILKELVFKLMH